MVHFYFTKKFSFWPRFSLFVHFSLLCFYKRFVGYFIYSGGLAMFWPILGLHMKTTQIKIGKILPSNNNILAITQE
jgi:hypothetical protein